jgi:DMSO/TMAO reductase YedYZ molybdopterin-dependent catalytic subunit
MHRLRRRDLLTATALAAGVQALGGKRVLGTHPEISVQDFEQYPNLITPVEDFFVRAHFDPPVIPPGPWKIEIKGQAPPVLLDKVANRVSIRSVLECAGNGVGVGAIGCGEWSGIRLPDFLRNFDIPAEAKFVRFTGRDAGQEPDSIEELRYSRTLPVDEVMRPESLLAGYMNGAPLELSHGGPVRVLFPGRYGMDSVKWVSTIEFLKEPQPDFFMVHRFRRVLNGNPQQSIGRMVPKSIIIEPKGGSVLRGAQVTAGGFAWSGAERLVSVHVRLDGGKFVPARLQAPAASFEWTRWSLERVDVRPGVHLLEAKATNAAGLEQPWHRSPSRDDEYELNHFHAVHFAIRP